jgi:hypothetical protein
MVAPLHGAISFFLGTADTCIWAAVVNRPA